jgi:hypothetical protein
MDDERDGQPLISGTGAVVGTVRQALWIGAPEWRRVQEMRTLSLEAAADRAVFDSIGEESATARAWLVRAAAFFVRGASA